MYYDHAPIKILIWNIYIQVCYFKTFSLWKLLIAFMSHNFQNKLYFKVKFKLSVTEIFWYALF